MRGVIRLRAAVLVAASALLGGCDAGSVDRAPGGRPGDGARLVAEARPAMGTRFEIKVVVEDEDAGRRAIDDAFREIERVESLLSEWRPTSEISAVNARGSDGPVRAGVELIEVLERAREISELTEGAFDVTTAACWRLWSFSEPRIPADDALAGCLAGVDYRGVRIDRAASTVRLERRGMQLGIAGIGKGYGIDRAARSLERSGVREYLVDGGGDVRVRGEAAAGPWRVGIAHPRDTSRLFGRIELADASVATSGDYQQFFVEDSVRYHHILDPRTGLPARGATSVTVIAPDATTADALATALFVMGADAGLKLAARLDGVEALIFDGALHPRATAGFPPSGEAPVDRYVTP